MTISGLKPVETKIHLNEGEVIGKRVGPVSGIGPVPEYPEYETFKGTQTFR